MVKHYQKHHKPEMEKPHHDPEVVVANCGWFDMKAVMDFLTYISGGDKKANGLRIYFGGRIKNDADKGKNTVILVGTTKEGTRNVDLSPNLFAEKDNDPTYAFRADDDTDFDNSHLHPPGDGGETILAEAQKP